MSSWINFFGKKDNKNSARDAIVGLRQQLLMLEKKEEHLNKKIEDELKKAKANVTTNKRGTCCSPLFEDRRTMLVYSLHRTHILTLSPS